MQKERLQSLSRLQAFLILALAAYRKKMLHWSQRFGEITLHPRPDSLSDNVRRCQVSYQCQQPGQPNQRDNPTGLGDTQHRN
jgi:hypothetical protein